MELELGLKFTKARDDVFSELRIAKDRAGPLFLSKETETMFVLTVHLKGFKRDRIKIDINEDGTQIAISGEKPVQEMVMVRWTMYKKEVEIKGFRKAFRIPDGVILDRIKAKFNEEESILSIFMPKSIKGIRGIEIMEVKEEHVDDGRSKPMPIAADEIPKSDDTEEALQPESEDPPLKTIEEGDRTGETSTESPEIGNGEESEEIKTEEPPTTTIPEITKPLELEPDGKHDQSIPPDSLPSTKFEPAETPETPPIQPIRDEELPQEKIRQVISEEVSKEEDPSPEIKEAIKVEPDRVLHQQETPAEDQPATQQNRDPEAIDEKDEEVPKDDVESPKTELKKSFTDRSTQTERPPSRKFPFCFPCIFAGSALLASLIVLVVQLHGIHGERRNKKS